MNKKSKEERMRDNLEEIGIKEEAYWRFWYDMYNANIVACNPVHPIVLKRYGNIPDKYRMKFMNERNKSK